MLKLFRRAKQAGNRASEDHDDICEKETDNCASPVRPGENRRSNGIRQRTTKDVINLLMPEKSYGKEPAGGVSGFFQRMAGGKRSKLGCTPTWSRPPAAGVDIEEAQPTVETRAPVGGPLTSAPGAGAGDGDAATRAQADFVRDLVLEKYARRRCGRGELGAERDRKNNPIARENAKDSPAETSPESDSVDETMGSADSKQNAPSNPELQTNEQKTADAIPEIVLEVEDKDETTESIETESETESEENSKRTSPIPIKSNLKIPKVDSNCASDDDSSIRSGDSAKKKVTFKKTIDFDDGDEQTDDEIDSTFESLTSEDDVSSDEGPDNDELLGGEIVIVEADSTTNNSNSFNIDDYHDSESDLKTADEIPTIVSEYEDLARDDSDSSLCGDIVQFDKSDSNDLTFDAESFDGSTTDEGSCSDEHFDRAAEIDQCDIDQRNLVNQEGRFQEQVSQLTELAAARSSEADSLRWKLDEVKRELEVKDAGAERLRAELSSASKEAELVRQRLKFLEDELTVTRTRSADLAEQLALFEGSEDYSTLAEVERLKARIEELEARLAELELEKKALLDERQLYETRADEAVAACDARWRRAHEKARSEAAERAERVLADCEWKMRELEMKAREADKKLLELTQKSESQTQPDGNTAPTAELTQLRGLSHEQQRALRAAGARAGAAEQREAALAQDLMRLRELIDRDRAKASETEMKYKEEISSQDERIQKRLDEQRRALMTLNQNSVRLEVEKVRSQLEKEHVEKQRAALQQQRSEHERAVKCVERRLKEAQARLENLKDVVSKKESQFQTELAEARSTADWDLLQLRHLLDRADIKYAQALDELQEKHEKEIEKLNEEWSKKLEDAEAASAAAAGAARSTLDSLRSKMLAEKLDQINKIKEQHKKDMEEQWEEFMIDKEHCLSRMKTECRLEGEEDRVKREKELSAELKDMKAEIVSKTSLVSNLKEQLVVKERRFAVTDQELRDALAREEALREELQDLTEETARSDEESRSTIDHLTRKCACLTKLFEEMRARLEARDAASAADGRRAQEVVEALRAEICRLNSRLAECGPPGDRTSADGCDSDVLKDSEISEASEPDFLAAAPRHSKAPTHEPFRKGGGRRRARSVDLPAVQVPVRIRQFDGGRKTTH